MNKVPIQWQNGRLSNLEEDPVRLLRGVRFLVQVWGEWLKCE